MVVALDVAESMKLLEKYGIPVAAFKVAAGADAVADAAENLGFPLVMKIVSEEHTHKTDVGGVVVGLKDIEEVRKAYEKLSKISEKVLVQKMVPGREVIVGIKMDAVFGPAIMFGLGGIFVELFKDVSFRLCPINESEAKEMTKEIKASKILYGYRGSKQLDIAGIVDILVKTSKLAASEGNIESLDINPVMISEDGAIAVDARILVNE